MSYRLSYMNRTYELVDLSGATIGTFEADEGSGAYGTAPTRVEHESRTFRRVITLASDSRRVVYREEPAAVKVAVSPRGIEPEAPLGNVAAALQASLLAREPTRLSALARADDPTVQLDDGSLLRASRIRGGFRIEHVTRSGGAPEQTWDVDEHGRAIR